MWRYKANSFVLAFFLFSNGVYSQTPGISKQHSYGGSFEDVATTITKTGDGGIIVAGYSHSNDKDVSGHHGSTGSSDGWVLKFDSQLKLQWNRSYGGSEGDGLAKIRQTEDGGYILIGTSNSTDGDASSHHGNTLTSDVWIVKINAAGDTDWTRSLGGTNDDTGNDIRQTSDLGYIIAATSSSADGDLKDHHGPADQNDGWFIKLDKDGKILWEHSYGGSLDDNGTSIVQTADGYLAIGFTASNDGDASGHHGTSDSTDIWLLHLDPSGKLLNQKQIGGSGDEIGLAIEKTADGNFFIGALTLSGGGDITSYKFTDSTHIDTWIAKINEAGKILWQNAVIGANESTSFLSVTSDGGAVFCGLSYPNDTATDTQLNPDGIRAFVCKLNKDGIIEWQGIFPGGTASGATAIVELQPHQFAFAGLDRGTGGNVTNNNGDVDYWIAEFTDPANSVRNDVPANGISIFPNPTSELITIHRQTDESVNILVRNILGETVFKSKTMSGNDFSFDLSKLASGIYYISIATVNSVLTKMVVKE